MIELLPAGFEGSTRDRLLAAGTALFAEHGYSNTTVGAIEAAAGLQPRRGAMYHYFPTKQALLEAAIESHLTAVEHGRRQVDGLTGADIRSEALVIGRWFLAELDAQRYMTRILEQDGDRLPRVRDMIRETFIDGGHRIAEVVIAAWLGPSSTWDTEALAVILIAPLVNLRRAQWTYGRSPLGVTDDQILDTWADTCQLFADATRNPS